MALGVGVSFFDKPPKDIDGMVPELGTLGERCTGESRVQLLEGHKGLSTFDKTGSFCPVEFTNPRARAHLAIATIICRLGKRGTSPK